MTVALSTTTGCETVAVKWSSERLRSLERAWSRVTCSEVSTGTVMGSERSESAAVAVIKPAKRAKLRKRSGYVDALRTWISSRFTQARRYPLTVALID